MQEMWLRLYLSNLVLIAAINVKRHPHKHHQAPCHRVCPAAGVAPPTGRGPPHGHGGPGVPEDQVLSTVLSVMAQWMAIPGEEPREGRQLWVKQSPSRSQLEAPAETESSQVIHK